METLLEPIVHQTAGLPDLRTSGPMSWHPVCTLDDLRPGTGVAALIGRRQIALFRPDDDCRLYALANFDPFSRAMVLSRGLIGDQDGVWFVASPIYKQRFRLDDGICLDDPTVAVASHHVRLHAGRIEIHLRD
jgi:nitrite reductase (NADH) small subunit